MNNIILFVNAMKFHYALIVENFITKTDINYLHEMITDGIEANVDILIVEYNCQICDVDPMRRMHNSLENIGYRNVAQIENDYMNETNNKYETKIKLIYVKETTMRKHSKMTIANFLYEHELTAKHICDYNEEFKKFDAFYV